MIKILDDFPDNVIAVFATGRVTKNDYAQVLIPKVEDVLKHHTKVRCYYEIGADFSGMEAGAAWEDFVVGIKHLWQWERVAVVTDLDWIRKMMSALRFLLPGKLMTFGTNQSSAARAWVTAE